MINRIKQWDFKNLKINDKSIINFSLFLSIFALVLSIPSGTPCLSANECQVGSDATFTNDVNIKSGTNYNLTLGHNYAQSVIANFEEVGGNHTGSVILKDNSGDMNLNGGLVLGTSATSTNGTIRWNGSEVQVYNTGWTGVGGADQNVFTTISGNSGSLTASTTTTSIKLEASADSGLQVVASGDKLEIQSSGSGGGSSTEFANYYINSDQSLTYSGVSTADINYGTERLDTENCFSPSNAYTIIYDASCNSAYYQINLTQIISFSGLTNNGAMIQGAIQTTGGAYKYRTWTTLFSIPNYTLNMNYIACLDPTDYIYVDFYHGAGYSTGSATWLGGSDESSLSFIKLQDKGSGC